MESRRTDLALEARELYQEQTLREPPGVDWKEEEQDGIHMTEVHIRTPEGAQEMGKPQGRYITFQLGEHWEREDHTIAAASSLLACQVRRLLPSQPESVLIVGLGNRHLTADALGPLCTEKIIVTRHLKDTMPDVFRSFARVSAIAPGVLGLTGVETGEVVLGLCEKIRPDAIIAIDSLVSRKLSRLCRTIQLSDTGITPGGGIAPGRVPLDDQTLPTPVLALGIPTVVEARTLAADLCPNAPPEEELPPTSLIVTPKDIDALMVKSAKILGYAIDMALHTHLSVEDIESLLS